MFHLYKKTILLFLVFLILSNTIVASASSLAGCIANVGDECKMMEGCGSECIYSGDCSEDMYYGKLCECMTGAYCGNLDTAQLISMIFGALGENITNPFEYTEFSNAAEYALEKTNYIDSQGLLSVFDESNEANFVSRLNLLKTIENISGSYAENIKNLMKNVGNDGRQNYSYEYQDIFDAFNSSKELDANCTSSTLACAIAKYEFNPDMAWNDFDAYLRGTTYSNDSEYVSLLKDQLQNLVEYKVLDTYLSRVNEWHDYYNDQYNYTAYLLNSFYEYRGKESLISSNTEYDLGSKVEKPVNRNQFEFGPDIMDLLSQSKDYDTIRDNTYSLYLQTYNDAEYILTQINKDIYNDYNTNFKDFSPYFEAFKIGAYANIAAGGIFTGLTMLPVGALDFLDPLITGSLFNPVTVTTASTVAAETTSKITNTEKLKPGTPFKFTPDGQTYYKLEKLHNLDINDEMKIMDTMVKRVSEVVPDSRRAVQINGIIREAFLQKETTSPVIAEIINSSTSIKDACRRLALKGLEFSADMNDPLIKMSYTPRIDHTGPKLFSINETQLGVDLWTAIDSVFMDYVLGKLP